MRTLMALVVLTTPFLAQADERADYNGAHGVHPPDEAQLKHVQACLAAWGEHPFAEAPETIREMRSSVRVMGFGAELRDDVATSWPQLVLVEPAVNVMTKTTIQLNNPNGWYCLNANVTVMGKFVIKKACDARLADARSGADVIAESETDSSVTVLGTVRVESTGCPAAK
ncbi:MAG: hypothetical protein KC912_21925 [Proteobacteria bacterium]|nr:hypothetical protein [Pseudomonadota bacterium]